MICETCGQQTYCGAVLTKYGNEIEYEECEKCGLIHIEDIEDS